MNMSPQSHASSSSSHLMRNRDESVGVLPELCTAAIPTVTKQIQLIPTDPVSAYSPQPLQKQIAVAPRPLHQHRYQYHGAGQVYPPRLASHEEVSADRDLFFGTLAKFHVALGTKLTVPKIGGRDLDLHLLYREVTTRGGLEMVINERKWKEITVVLNFPRTTTSASFVLRKYYINLLHHYEQVYFFQVQGHLVPPPAPQPSASPATNQIIEAEYTHSALKVPETDLRKRKIDAAQALGVDPASSIGSVVTGFIDGKIEHSYLVTVMVGTRKMRGVLYHVPPSNTRPQGARVSSFMNSLEADFKHSAAGCRFGHRKRRKEMSRKDPNAPRQNRTGYNFFFAEQRAKLKSVQPDKDRAISKMIGNLWNQLSNDEKSPYQERGLKDKERYKREMREYKERLRLQGQNMAATNDSQNSLHLARKYDHISTDSEYQVELRLKEAMLRQEELQPGSQNDSGMVILENQSCGSGTGSVEDHSSKDENPVLKQEQGVCQGSPVLKQEQGVCQGSLGEPKP